MNELIKAFTELCKEATKYLEKMNGVERLPMIVPKGFSLPTAGAEEVPPPTEMKYPGPTEGAIKKAKAPTKKLITPIMTEAESAERVQLAAKAYVQRYQNETPNGIDRARAILLEQFKAAKIKDLNHDQRVSFIGTLEAAINGGA